MPRWIGRAAIAAPVAIALALASAQGAFGALGATTMSGYVDTSGVALVLHNGGSFAFGQALARLDNGTATGCAPSTSCLSGGPYAQFDFNPPQAPGSTSVLSIFTSPVPYSGTVDLKVFGTPSGEVDLFGVPVKPGPDAGGVDLPAKAKVDPRSGLGSLPIAKTAPEPDFDFTDAFFAFSCTRGGCQAGHEPKVPHAADARAKTIRIGTLASVHIPAVQDSATSQLKLTAKGRRLLRAAGKLRVTVNATLRDSVAGTPFSASLKLVAAKSKK